MPINTPPPSNLDFTQIIKSSFDDSTGSLRIIGSVAPAGGETEVFISDLDDDSVKVGDGSGRYLKINSDGSININLTSEITDGVVNIYNEATSVATGVDVSIVSYAVPLAKTFFLQRIEASGENISQYYITLNGTRIATKRTYFTGGLNVEFIFSEEEKVGFQLNAGDIIQVRTVHQRPASANFEARLVGILK